MTTDAKSELRVWNVEKECLSKIIKHPSMTGAITDVIELDILQLQAIASMNKKVTIWNLVQGQLVITIEPPDIPALGV